MRPDLAILASTLLWGSMWIPVRQLNGAGWEQGMAITVSMSIAAVMLLPFLFPGRRWMQVAGAKVWALGLLFGFGIALYLEAIVRGTVARVVLLFYLMPVWSAILGRLINGDPITLRRVVGIGLGVSGLAIIFYDGSGFPLPSSASDFMALFSGVIWALAFAFPDHSKKPMSTFGQVFAALVLMGPAFYLLSHVPGSRDSIAVMGLSGGASAGVVWLVALAVIWLLPAVTLTLFGAGRLQSSQVAIFLMLEVAISLISAAVLLDEPFGLRETLGATLIIAASFAEFDGFGKRSVQNE